MVTESFENFLKGGKNFHVIKQDYFIENLEQAITEKARTK